MIPLGSHSRRFGALLLLSSLALTPAFGQRAKAPKKAKTTPETTKSTVARLVPPKSGSASGDASKSLIDWKGGSVSLSEFEAAYKRMNDRSAYETTLDSLKDF